MKSLKVYRKSLLSKLNFFLGRNPVIEHVPDSRKYIPDPYKAVITITADFELAWAWRYAKGFDDPYQTALKLARRERENVPKVLKLCDEYEVPITWATVGHLFLEACEKNDSHPHPHIPQPGHYENEFCRYNGSEWFEHDPCSNYRDAPEWYAPDLIARIFKAKVKHEIGCHTFSHIDCRDEVCPPELFEAEISECKNGVAQSGIELKSFVHPGHTIGNLDTLAALGFTSFQTDPGNILGYPVKYNNGLWEFKRTYEFVYRKDWCFEYHIHLYKKIIDRAIKSSTVCNFWFHPSFESIVVDKILPSVFSYINDNKCRLFVTTVGEYVDWLERRNIT